MTQSEVLAPTSTQAGGSGGLRSHGWLLLALALFLLQVLPFLSYRWVTDESWYAGPAYSVAHGSGLADPEIGPNDLEHRIDTRPPGTALTMAASFRAFGTSVVTARLGSVIAGVLVVLLTWRLTRPLLGDAGAAVATLITGTDNLLVAVSRTARPEALTLMAVLFSLLAISRYAASPGRARSQWALLSGALMAMGAMFHITMAGYLVSLGLLAIGIDRKRGDAPWRGVLAVAAGFLAGLLPFILWVFTSPLNRMSFHSEYLGRAGHGDSLGVRLLHELHRYSDVLGLNVLHSHGLDNLPVRLPIPLLFLAATVLLWRYARRWFYLEMALLLPTVFWFIETVNKSSRYLALLAPVLGFAMAAAVTVVRPRWRPLAFAAATFVVVAQLGANLVLLRGASKANYSHVGNELVESIPAGEAAYGTITFWLALRDHTFISEERTTPEMAAKDFGVHYFILGDRMMAEGSSWDADYYEKTRASLADIEQRGTLVRSMPDPYYGNLRIYRLP